MSGEVFVHAGQPVAGWTETAASGGPAWLVRFFVDAIDDAVQRALTLGAHRHADEPAVLVDPLGAMFGFATATAIDVVE